MSTQTDARSAFRPTLSASPITRVGTRLLRLALGQPAPDHRFEVERGRVIRTFVTFMLLVQVGFAVLGAMIGGANALSSDPRAETWAAVALISLSVILVAAVRLSRQPYLIELSSFFAGLVSLGVAAFGAWQNPASTLAVVTYLAVAIAIAAFAIPWRPLTHYAWVAAATCLATSSLGTVASSDQRDAFAGAIAFAVVVSLIGKPLAWRSRIDLHLRINEIRRLNKTLAGLSYRDAQTGIGNRAALDTYLSRLVNRAGGRVGFVMVDIDDFKALNDALGHAAGDETLRRVSEIVVRAVRDVDHVYRYGGDEFLVALERSNAPGLTIAAERIRSSVATAAMPATEQMKRQVTVSIGVSSVELPATGAALLAAIDTADQFLYQAKRAGKNRVEPAQPTTRD